MRSEKICWLRSAQSFEVASQSGGQLLDIRAELPEDAPTGQAASLPFAQAEL